MKQLKIEKDFTEEIKSKIPSGGNRSRKMSVNTELDLKNRT